jgi:hypothetical protein
MEPQPINNRSEMQLNTFMIDNNYVLSVAKPSREIPAKIIPKNKKKRAKKVHFYTA